MFLFVSDNNEDLLGGKTSQSLLVHHCGKLLTGHALIFTACNAKPLGGVMKQDYALPCPAVSVDPAALLHPNSKTARRPIPTAWAKEGGLLCPASLDCPGFCHILTFN